MEFFNEYRTDTNENRIEILLTFDENVNENENGQPKEKMNENHPRKLLSKRALFIEKVSLILFIFLDYKFHKVVQNLVIN